MEEGPCDGAAAGCVSKGDTPIIPPIPAEQTRGPGQGATCVCLPGPSSGGKNALAPHFSH